jgi:membrane protein implicated in regulation of membrane protease activity
MTGDLDLFNDPVHRRFAIRFILMVGIVAGSILGLLFPWWVAVAGIAILSTGVTLLTLKDLRSASKTTTEYDQP